MLLWRNALGYLTDIFILLLVVSVESQLDSFNVLRQELRSAQRERRESRWECANASPAFG